MTKIYPNDLCPCGSGKKYKHCCAKKATSTNSINIHGFPVDTVENGAEFIANRKGAVVFIDESKQPVLDIAEGSTVKTVLSVGFSKSRKPLVTIQEEDGAVCYILPDSYLEWCTACVGMAMGVANLFPSDVEFTRRGNRYAADIL